MKKGVLVGLLAAGVLVGVGFSASGSTTANTSTTAITSMAGTNNPGGITYNVNSSLYIGVVNNYINPLTGVNFCVFDTINNGVLAIEQLLQGYFASGLTTILQIANRWTNSNPTAPANYLAIVSLAPMFNGQTITVNSDISAIANSTPDMAYLIAGVTVNEGIIPLTSAQVLNYI